ncbi:CHAT domain-containing protein, partial [Tenacibaculum sp. Cn5-34]
MKKFYENLKNKQSKIDALNNAKRTYLESHSLSEKSPYYWASFVLIGDTNNTFTTNYFYFLLCAFLSLVILLIYLKKKY